LANEVHLVILAFQDCPVVLVQMVLQVGQVQHRMLPAYRKEYSNRRHVCRVLKALVAFPVILVFQEIQEILAYRESLVICLCFFKQL
uniref:Secreted protein n=1 Tax=Gongylonema pulchrum TaxID=637853 RepID=A0A183DJG0_9BILA